MAVGLVSNPIAELDVMVVSSIQRSAVLITFLTSKCVDRNDLGGVACARPVMIVMLAHGKPMAKLGRMAVATMIQSTRSRMMTYSK